MLTYCLPFLLTVLVSSQETGYRVWLEDQRPCGEEQNPIFDLSSAKLTHYNRTTIIIAGEAKALQTIDQDANMRMIAYIKNAHGKWTKTLLDTKTVKACEYIKTDDYFWPNMVKISDLPEGCPINQGSYHFKDARLSLDRLPPMLPLGCYKINLVLSSSEHKSCNNFYLKVTGPKDSPNPRCIS